MNLAMQLTDASEDVLETCLIVDDDDFDRKQIRRVLERQRPSMQVIEFSALADARRYLDTAKADIILLDNHLPDGIGSELATELRGDPKHMESPIIVITNDDVSTLDHGVTALSKDDLNSKALSQLIWDYLKTRRIARQIAKGEASGDMKVDRNGLAPAISRAIRTLRVARSQVVQTAPISAIAGLDQVEDILLAISEATASRKTMH